MREQQTVKTANCIHLSSNGICVGKITSDNLEIWLVSRKNMIHLFGKWHQFQSGHVSSEGHGIHIGYIYIYTYILCVCDTQECSSVVPYQQNNSYWTHIVTLTESIPDFLIRHK